MQRILIFINSFLILTCIVSCNKPNNICENKDFAASLDNYCKYIDSVGYELNFEYIIVEASVKEDCTVFLIYLNGGSYDFLNYSKTIIDFFVYKKYDIMLKGDFPNEIVNIKKNKKLNIVNDIVKVRYPLDYSRYLNDPNSVGPLIYDYMTMTLVFKMKKLVSCKKQYY